MRRMFITLWKTACNDIRNLYPDRTKKRIIITEDYILEPIPLTVGLYDPIYSLPCSWCNLTFTRC